MTKRKQSKSWRSPTIEGVVGRLYKPQEGGSVHALCMDELVH